MAEEKTPDQLRGEITGLTAQLSEAGKELQRLKAMETSYIPQSEDLGRTKAERDEAQKNLDENRIRVEKLEQELTALKAVWQKVTKDLAKISGEDKINKENLAQKTAEIADLRARLEKSVVATATAEGARATALDAMDKARAESKDLGTELNEADQKRKRNFRWAFVGWAMVPILLHLLGVCAWIGWNYYYETGPFAQQTAMFAITGTVEKVTVVTTPEEKICRIETREGKIYTVRDFDNKFYTHVTPKPGDKLVGTGITKEGKYFVLLDPNPKTKIPKK